MQNSINIQPRRNQTFTGDDGLKKLYKVCIDDYDNNEYLAVKYIKSFYQRYHMMFAV